MKNPTHSLLGLPLGKFTHKSFNQFLDHLLSQGQHHHLITIYSEYLVKAQKDPSFKTILQKAHTLTADGIGPIWAAHFLATKHKSTFHKIIHLITSGFSLIFRPNSFHHIFPARISGADFWLDICQKCQAQNLTIFLHNKPDGLSDFHTVKSALKTKFPHLQIVGDFSFSPPLSKTAQAQILAKINQIQPHVIFSALGVPHQDIFLSNILPQCPPSVKLGVGIGASFDFLTGTQTRAPKWMQSLGLEWAWRLLTRPHRLPRIWQATISFIKIIWQQSSPISS